MTITCTAIAIFRLLVGLLWTMGNSQGKPVEFNGEGEFYHYHSPFTIDIKHLSPDLMWWLNRSGSIPRYVLCLTSKSREPFSAAARLTKQMCFRLLSESQSFPFITSSRSRCLWQGSHSREKGYQLIIRPQIHSERWRCVFDTRPEQSRQWVVFQVSTWMVANNTLLLYTVVRSESVRNIIRERRMLEHVNHPFICNLRYSFQDIEYMYLVVDLMSGGDLRFHISRKTFTEDAVRFWIAELGCALRYIHGQGIIHRDVKPDNVLLDADGHVHLTDFVSHWMPQVYMMKVQLANMMLSSRMLHPMLYLERSSLVNLER